MKISREDHNKFKELEESLWRTETRFNREYMDRILAPDFFEFGRSGRIYQRADTLAAPFAEIHAELPLDDLAIHLIDTNVALVTYTSKVTHEQVEVANRSSIWCKTAAGWQIRFHQGTPVIA